MMLVCRSMLDVCMPALEQQVEEYLRETLGNSSRIDSWEGAAGIPAFLADRYRFAQTELMGRELLLVLDDSPEPEAPAVIRKHVGKLHEKWPAPIVYVREQVTAYNRKRLIEQRVPFIIPGNQMYLPELGLDLREYFRTPPPTRRRLRPATQSVLIHVLLNRDPGEFTATRLAPVLGYSAMTLSRAFDELEAVEIAETDTVGRERVLRLESSCRDTWERARPWLLDPVRSRHVIAGQRPAVEGLRAGLDALARYSMLAEPRKPVIAIGHKQWLSIQERLLDGEVADLDAANTEIEVWKYVPREYRVHGLVEPLSLYLSLRTTTEERVEQALDEMMEQVSW